MQPEQIRTLLDQVREGKCTVDSALDALACLPFTDLGTAKLDHHRALRCGFAEVVFAPGKRAVDIIRILENGLASVPCMLTTRVDEAQAELVLKHFPAARYNLQARTILCGRPVALAARETVTVVTAGTSDIPVAEEALETLRAFGCEASRHYDVGVAGLHRVLEILPEIRKAVVIICVAGMDGALPSVVGGLVSCPVIAVPSSIGYGASFSGLAALLAMLNTCAAGVSVVNIDNGFGAAMCALRIVTQERRGQASIGKNTSGQA